MVRQLAGQVVDSLRNQPALLASIITNLILLAGFGYILSHISEASTNKDKIIAELSQKCNR
jgi:hypothetical protein